MRKAEESKKIKSNDTLGDIYDHPAYGTIGISHVSSTGSALVGSSVRHNSLIELEIQEARRYDRRDRETFSAKRLICRVAMSHAQLAEMLFNANQGDGVPCTLIYVAGDPGLRPEPPFESPMKQSSDYLKGQLQEVLAKAEEMSAELGKVVEKGLARKADRERALFLARKIVQDIKMNLPYASRCVDEKMEKVVAHAKAEVDSFVEMKFRAAGVKSLLQQDKPALALENGKGKEGRDGRKV